MEFSYAVRARERWNFKILSMRTGGGILKFHLSSRRRVIGKR
ncbi:hypothetical protein [uncultured Campylobacter sp.]|nr:hypothetical protein [uncultured Campylobacter sp.]